MFLIIGVNFFMAFFMASSILFVNSVRLQSGSICGSNKLSSNFLFNLFTL